MRHLAGLIILAVGALSSLAGCGAGAAVEPTAGPGPVPSPVEIISTPAVPVEPTATEAATAAPDPEGTEVAAAATALPTVLRDEDNEVAAEAERDSVFTVRNGLRQALPAPGRASLGVGDGVDVDEGGRAILQFADLLTVEILRNGVLQVQQLDLAEQAPLIALQVAAGAVVSDFKPEQAIGQRFVIQTEFATVTASGTRFLVVREMDSPLEWVISFEASEEDLQVSAGGVTKPVATGVARWIAPLGEPSPGISADTGNVRSWLERARTGVDQPEIGEVVWPQADLVADTSALSALPPPGQPFDLGQTDQGRVVLTLNPGGSYALEDCNGDGIRDLIVRAGGLQFDFRSILARVRAFDLTVINLDRPGSGGLRMLDPGRGEMASRQLEVDTGRGQVLSMRSPQPYHYAELALSNGCFLGLSLTPPTPAGEPGAPRPAVENWQEAVVVGEPVGVVERPPENGRFLAAALGGQAYEPRIEIDGKVEDWQVLTELSGVDWTAFETVAYDAACANPYPTPSASPDLAGRVRFAYDETYLFLAFLVEDDGYVGYTGDDQRYFLGDAAQLLLDLDLAGDFYRASLSPDDVQIDLHPGLEAAGGPSSRAALWQLDGLQSRLLQEARVAAVPTESGYFLEAAVPWQALNFAPQPGARLGLAASVNDNDTPGSNVQECLVSTAPRRDWTDPTTWGTLILGATDGGP